MKKIVSILLLLIMILGMTSCTGKDTTGGNEDGTQDGAGGDESEPGVALYFTAATNDPASESTEWEKKFNNTIINGGYKSFMPGEHLAFHVMVENESTVMMSYKLEFPSKDGFSNLTNVLEVYRVSLPDGPLDRSDLTNENLIGTLADNLGKVLISGAIAPEDGYYFTIVVKMKESAGNNFANMALGADLSFNISYEVFNSEDDSNPSDGSVDFPGVDF